MGERESKRKKSSSIDILKQTSDKGGLAGFFEGLLRRFRSVAFAVLISPVILSGACIMGMAAAPSVLFFMKVLDWTADWNIYLRAISLSCSLAVGYLIYGMTIIFLVPAINFCLGLRLGPWRGIWYSLQSIPWFIHNALTYIVRYTFLEFMTPSPLNILFYRLMGMKIGKGTVINTTNISDPSLITLGDYVTIGGSAHLMAHYGQKGYLILSPVTIGDYSTIGLKSSVMGGVRIGKNCMVKPHVAVLPKTVLKDGESL